MWILAACKPLNFVLLTDRIITLSVLNFWKLQCACKLSGLSGPSFVYSSKYVTMRAKANVHVINRNTSDTCQTISAVNTKFLLATFSISPVTLYCTNKILLTTFLSSFKSKKALFTFQYQTSLAICDKTIPRSIIFNARMAFGQWLT